MVCKVCKREIDSPVCSFCGEDNTPWINAAKDADPEPEKSNPAPTDGGSSKPAVRKYKVDYKKLVRLLIALTVVIVFVVLVVSMFSSDKKKQPKISDTLFTNDMIAVKSGSEWGYINSENIGGYAIAPQYKYVTDYSDGIAFAYIGNKYAVINKEGQLLTEPSFEAVGGVSENGYFAVKTGGKWGYIDKSTMGFAIEPKYSTAGVFTDDIALVSVNGLYGYIGTDGEYVIAPQYDFALGFSDGYAAIHSGGKWGYITKNGDAAIEPVYDEAQNFENGLAIVCYFGDYGVINTDGKFVIEPQFDAMASFDLSGNSKIKLGDKFGYVNKKGNYVINPRFSALGDFDGEKLTYAAGSDGKFGFINNKGEFVVEPQFEDAGNFYGGLAPVKKDGLWGYADSKGKMVIEAKYYEASRFYGDGYAVVSDESGKYQIIDKNGTNLLSSGVSVDKVLIAD